ncbi:hypothetical protein [Paenibacillus agaridevorans]|jgi:hypothetical protein|nr:hypothetical protein [Paenibacillus agaridevorans]
MALTDIMKHWRSAHKFQDTPGEKIAGSLHAGYPAALLLTVIES